MNTLQKSVLSTFSDGNWVFDLLHIPFIEALKTQIKMSGNFTSEELITTQLTLLMYLKIHLDINNKNPLLFIENSNFKDKNQFFFLSKAVYASGIPSNFSKFEKQVLYDTYDLINQKDSSIKNLINRIFRCYFRIKESNFCGASHPHAFGMYFAGDKFFDSSPDERAISLIHELAHQELFLIQLIDRLIEKEADENLAYAPYQGTQRPPIGRLHSLAALSRMIEYCNLFNGNYSLLKNLFNENLNSFTDFELTAFGKKLIQAMVIRTNKA